MNIAHAGLADVDALAQLHAASFAEAWTAAALADLMRSPSADALIATDEGTPFGFVLFWTPADEAEILTIAVAPAARRRGCGAALLSAAIAAAAARGARAMLLDVAENNVAARALYARFGFIEVARRRNYYAPAGPGADALVLRLDLPEPVD